MMMVVGAAVVVATGHRSSMGIVDWLAAVSAQCPPVSTTSHQHQLLLLIALTRGDTDPAATAARSHYRSARVLLLLGSVTLSFKGKDYCGSIMLQKSDVGVCSVMDSCWWLVSGWEIRVCAGGRSGCYPPYPHHILLMRPDTKR